MDYINQNYDPDAATNFYIGTQTGDQITNTYNVDLYDEETLVFTEPVTGAQYQTTGWTYDYNTRCYDMALEPGTFLIGDADIDQIKLTYGDDALTINYYDSGSLIQSDEYVYVVAEKIEPGTCQHDYSDTLVSSSTCTEAGIMKHTCSKCGGVVTETLPLAPHTYTYSVTRDPTCIDPGQRTGVCTVCGGEVVEDLEPLGHDFQPSGTTQTTYVLPPGTACPTCAGTDFTAEINKGSGVFDCTCNAEGCGTQWIAPAVITYGSTTYTCSRCGVEKSEAQDAESGLFGSIAALIRDGMGWIAEKLTELVGSLSGINDVFTDFVETIKNNTGQYPAFLGAVIALLPEDLMSIFWFGVVAFVSLAVWKKWFS